MSQETHHETAPEDRIPFAKKLIYGFGAFVNNILAAAIGGMIIVLNLGLGMNPALVGLLGALPRLTDAITDPLMGYISDNTRSRWGRRRPYIFVGAIFVGIIYALLWQLPVGKSESFYFWYFLSGSLIFYLAYTVYATPWVALGYELTPDYHERTRLMGVQNFIGNIAYMISPYFLAIMYSKRLFVDVVEGAASLAIMIGVVVAAMGILPALFLRERFKEVAIAEVDEHKEDDGDFRQCSSERHQGLPAWLRIDAKVQAVSQALRRDISRLQRIHPDCVFPVVRHYLLRLCRGRRRRGRLGRPLGTLTSRFSVVCHRIDHLARDKNR